LTFSAQSNECGCQRKEAEITAGQLVETGENPPITLDLVHEALDPMAISVVSRWLAGRPAALTQARLDPIAAAFRQPDVPSPESAQGEERPPVLCRAPGWSSGKRKSPRTRRGMVGYDRFEFVALRTMWFDWTRIGQSRSDSAHLHRSPVSARRSRSRVALSSAQAPIIVVPIAESATSDLLLASSRSRLSWGSLRVNQHR
jgi:hypothetical protein